DCMDGQCRPDSNSHADEVAVVSELVLSGFRSGHRLARYLLPDDRCHDNELPSSRRGARRDRRDDARRGRNQTALVFIPLPRPAPFDPGPDPLGTATVGGPPRLLQPFLPRRSVCPGEPAADQSPTHRGPRRVSSRQPNWGLLALAEPGNARRPRADPLERTPLALSPAVTPAAAQARATALSSKFPNDT